MNEKVAIRIPHDEETDEVEQRMEAIVWGLILVVTGVALLLPGWIVPIGGWLASLGLIFLGLNLARYVKGIETSVITTLKGLMALAAAGAVFLGFDLLILPILLIAAGAWIVVRQFARSTSGSS
jgi:hypothetical protein